VEKDGCRGVIEEAKERETEEDKRFSEERTVGGDGVGVMCVGEVKESVKSGKFVVSWKEMCAMDSAPERPEVIQDAIAVSWGATDLLETRGEGRGGEKGRNGAQDFSEDLDHERGHLERVLETIE
jgi:hypothetical protein